MGRQINFYAEAQLQKHFIEYFFNQGFVIIADDMDNKKIVTYHKLDEIDPNLYNIFLYKKDYGQLVTENWSNHTPSSLFSPVIEFSRTSIKPEEKLIIRGRVWMESMYYGEDGNIVTKDPRLTKDYNAIVRMIKKYVPYQDVVKGGYTLKAYITDNMKEMAKSGYRFI
ncbi:MAG: hypothetical protein GYA50_09105 [Eubacteriaceae bacterium]|nr:hypothetical protein [Eubacteriaceae bacterium]